MTADSDVGNVGLIRPATEQALHEMKQEAVWAGCFNGRESSLQQLSPYIGKLKSGIVRALIRRFSEAGDWICDPFSGSGVVLLEALLSQRKAAAADMSIYAYCLTQGKAEAPPALEQALKQMEMMLAYVEEHHDEYDLRRVDKWVRGFFHSQTLREIMAAFEYCWKKKQWFLGACLCGILHHQRPGFLSYPASHMVPYLRTTLFPREAYPELYGYRSLAERMRKKVTRTYRRTSIEVPWTPEDYDVRLADARDLPFASASMDLVITSPPYYDALDYARDNRLRLWFLGETDWRLLDSELIARRSDYEEQMAKCVKEVHRILKSKRAAIFIVGEVNRNGKTRDTGKVLGEFTADVTQGRLILESVVEDDIPEIRRSRRGTKTTRTEKLLIFRKSR